MPTRISANFQLYIRKIIRRFESLFVLAKEILSERNFIYLSCVAVAISCALAVIVLKSFAHNVFLLANYLNTYLSFMDAQRKTGIFNNNIVKCCKGERKTAGGYVWEYKKETL